MDWHITEKESSTEPEESLDNKEIESAISTRTIELPERRQLELDEEEIVENTPQEIDKIVEGPPALKQTPVASLPPQKSKQTFNPFLKKEKETNTGLFRKKLYDSLLVGSQKMDIEPSEEFEIDWIGDIKREISHKKLPEFPPDVQREATIKIQFTVLPNGLIGSAVLMQKGDTKLENITLETFKSWRFNPLPEYTNATPQTGTITFRFKLE